MKLFIHNIKYRLQGVFNRLGWHVSKYEPKRSESNIYKIQHTLLNGIEVQTIFDVGAWIGNSGVAYREHFPKATVHAFEPFPDSFEEVSKKTC